MDPATHQAADSDPAPLHQPPAQRKSVLLTAIYYALNFGPASFLGLVLYAWSREWGLPPAIAKWMPLIGVLSVTILPMAGALMDRFLWRRIRTQWPAAVKKVWVVFWIVADILALIFLP
jgi:hypothetical protein